MLQTYSSQPPDIYEDGGQNFGISSLIGIIKRRILYFVIPFLVVATIGAAVVEISAADLPNRRKDFSRIRRNSTGPGSSYHHRTGR